MEDLRLYSSVWLHLHRNYEKSKIESLTVSIYRLVLLHLSDQHMSYCPRFPGELLSKSGIKQLQKSNETLMIVDIFMS